MNEEFFSKKEFLELCKTNRVDPMITGDNRLVLMCPKYPGKNIEEKFKALIPEEVPWIFSEGLSQTTLARLKQGLLSVGFNKVMIQNLPGHRVVIDTIVHSMSPVMVPQSPLWDMISGLLKKDPFVETFAIRVNGQVVRDSSQYVGSSGSCPIDDAENPFSEEDHTETPQRAAKPSIVKDDRFDYERPFLPQDVGTDVKILLETTGTVEEFLKSI